ncbi:TPA: hypothetical protein ONC25_002583 [Enterobacter asburiae]|nr:hypothetical protein [Enterobacter asburiae]
MSAITKQWLQQKIADMEAARDEIPFGLDEDSSNTLAALRIALASLEAEHGEYLTHVVDDGYGEFSDRMNFSLPVGTKLYTAPPAPAVPGAATAIRACIEEFPESVHDIVEECAAIAENACRAAMLQGADGNSPVIPDGWVMVPVEPTEDMIVNGFESEPDESFSDERDWEAYDAMSGCQQAAHRAKLCWAAMIAASPAYKKS